MRRKNQFTVMSGGSSFCILGCQRDQPPPIVCFSRCFYSDTISFLKSTLTQPVLNCSNYSGDSFRIGAAMTAAATGLCDSTIQTLRRWSSDSFRCYIRLPPSELAMYSRMLVDRS